eukprot:TRINITY_DN68177_c3_g1_i1.p1 TRINITY_DN68177_c3_g1~~TRINITY_DN68177_c3_g1_i1.p1  ORF type:complete len:525 (+),score=21.41 TRINITY_DN68177_c3_g1_i1:60-1634(+)
MIAARFKGLYLVTTVQHTKKEHVLQYINLSNKTTIADVSKDLPADSTLWFDNGPLPAPLGGGDTNTPVESVALPFPMDPTYCMLRMTTAPPSSGINLPLSSHTAPLPVSTNNPPSPLSGGRRASTCSVGSENSGPLRRRGSTDSNLSTSSRKSARIFPDDPELSFRSSSALEPKKADELRKWLQRAANSYTSATTSNADAILQCNKAIEIHGGCADAFFLRAMIRMKADELNAAMDDIHHAIQIQGKGKYYAMLGQCFLLERPPKLQDALAAVDKALDDDPVDPTALQLKSELNRSFPATNRQNSSKPCSELHCSHTVVPGQLTCAEHCKSPSPRAPDIAAWQAARGPAEVQRPPLLRADPPRSPEHGRTSPVPAGAISPGQVPRHYERQLGVLPKANSFDSAAISPNMPRRRANSDRPGGLPVSPRHHTISPRGAGFDITLACVAVLGSGTSCGAIPGRVVKTTLGERVLCKEHICTICETELKSRKFRACEDCKKKYPQHAAPLPEYAGSGNAVGNLSFGVR